MDGVEANPFFSRHAAAYAQAPGFIDGADLHRLLELVGPCAGQDALDVGTGTGHTALALAAAGAAAIGLDPTPAMLAEAGRLAEARPVPGSLRFVLGVAERLPFATAAFDVVTCRRAAHHFADLPAALREMARVLRPAGRLAIADTCPPPPWADAANALERLRDTTHVEARDEQGWAEAIRAAGLRLETVDIAVEEISFDEWLRPVAPQGPEAEATRRSLAALPAAAQEALAGTGPGGWRKRRVILLARRIPPA